MLTFRKSTYGLFSLFGAAPQNMPGGLIPILFQPMIEKQHLQKGSIHTYKVYWKDVLSRAFQYPTVPNPQNILP